MEGESVKDEYQGKRPRSATNLKLKMGRPDANGRHQKKMVLKGIKPDQKQEKTNMQEQNNEFADLRST